MAIDAVTGAFTAAGQSGVYFPFVSDRSTKTGQFNVFLETSDFHGAAQLECQRPGSSQWCKIGVWSAGAFTQTNAYTFAGSEGNTKEIVVEPEAGCAYRLNCTAFTSGTLTYSIEGGR